MIQNRYLNLYSQYVSVFLNASLQVIVIRINASIESSFCKHSSQSVFCSFLSRTSVYVGKERRFSQTIMEFWLRVLLCTKTALPPAGSLDPG